jgi:integrase
MSQPPAQGRRRPRKVADKHLTPVRDARDVLVGWRFAPGPAMRSAGAKPRMLKRPDGSWMSQVEARAARDALLADLAFPVAPKSPDARASDAVAAARAAKAARRPDPPAFDPRAPRAAVDAQKTLGNLRDAFLIACATAGGRFEVRPATTRFYAMALNAWTDLLGADCPIADFSRADIGDALDFWNEVGKSLTTIQARYKGLQAALSYACQIAWIDFNPATKLGLEKPPPRRRRATDAELTALIETADAMSAKTGDPNWAQIGTAIVAAVWTAQRQADLLAFDLGRQMRADATTGRMRLHFRQGKTDAKVGPPLMPALAARLAGRTDGPLIIWHASANRSRKPRASDVKRGEGWTRPVATAAPAVSAPRAWGHWQVDTFRHAWATLREKAGVTDLEFRDLRDTAITRLHEAGADAIRIASWSGHKIKSVQQILDHYIDPQQSVADEVADLLDAWAKKRGIAV